MGKCSELPEEILLLIFESHDVNRDRRDLFEYEMVCKSWKLPAQRVAYSSVNIFTTLSAMKLLAALQKNKKESPGKFVKTLGLYFNVVDQIRYMDPFSKIFPFLETIKKDKANDIVFYQKLYDIGKKSRWLKLKRIPSPMEGHEAMYFKCAKRFSKSLEEFSIQNHEGPTSFGGARMSREHESSFLAWSVEKMNHFPHLKTLIFQLYSNNMMETFDAILERHPYLTTVDFRIYSCRDCAPANDTTVDLSLIIPRPYIKNLEAISVIHEDTSLLYIMRKYPQLTKLIINFDIMEREAYKLRLNFLSAEYSFTTATLVKFLLYAQNVPTHHIEVFVKKSGIADVLVKYSEAIPNSRLQPFKIQYTNSHLGMDTESTLKNVKLIMETPSLDDTLKGFGVEYYFSSFYQETYHTLAHFEVLENIGAKLESLQIIVPVMLTPAGSDTGYKMCNGYFLDHIFQHCPNLTRLYLKEMRLFKCNPDDMFQNKSITHLYIGDGTVLGINMLPELSLRLPSLKHLQLIDCRYPELRCDEYIDLPHSSLETLTVAYGIHRGHTVYLKASTTELRDQYYKFVMGKKSFNYIVEKSTQEEYDYIEIVPYKIMKLPIRCKSLKTFILKPSYDGRHCSLA